MKKQKLAFGHDVVEVVAKPRGSASVLSKPKDQYLNLTLSADVPRPISYSKSYGFGWSREFNKPEVAPLLFSCLSVEELCSLRQLRSFSLDGVSLMGCIDTSSATGLGLAFGAMSQLKSLKLTRVFSVERSVQTKEVPEVNKVFQNFCAYSLIDAANIQDLESHYNNLSVMTEQSWNALGSALASLKKLRRLSIKETTCDVKTSKFLWNALKNITALESCEIKILNSENTLWDPFIDYLKTNQNLSVVEVGSFDLNNNTQAAAVKNIWKALPKIQSFGLKLVNLNTPSIISLFEMLYQKDHQNFSQLILEVENLKEMDLIQVHVHQLLDKSTVLDVRIVMDGVDVTPVEIAESCTKKRDALNTTVEEAIDNENRSESVVSFNRLIPRLGGYPSSVFVLEHQIDLMFQSYNYLMWLDEDQTKHLKIAEFYERYVQWVECGKISREVMIKRLSQHWGKDDCDLFLSLVPVIIAACTPEEMDKLAQNFLKVFELKCFSFEERYYQSGCDNQKLFNEISVFIDFIYDPKHHILLSSQARNSMVRQLSYFKTLLSRCLGENVDYFKKCIRSQLAEIVGTNDLELFFRSFREVHRLIFRESLDYAESILQLILSAIKDPALLAAASQAIDLERQPGNANSEVFPSDQRKCLTKSLPILLMAKRRGYVDKEGLFERMLSDYKFLTMFSVDRGRTIEENDAHLLKEIDELAQALFKTEAKVEIRKTEEKVEVSLVPAPKSPIFSAKRIRPLGDLFGKQTVDSEESKRPSLKDLLRNQPDSTGKERVPLKDLLSAKPVSSDAVQVPLKALLRSKKSGHEAIHVRANNGNFSESVEANEFVFTRELLLEFLEHNKDTRVLEVGNFDLNKPEDLHFIADLLKECGSLRSFGLKLINFTISSARGFLKLLNKKDLPALSQLILNVDMDLKGLGHEKVDLDWFAKEVLEATNVIDIRIVDADADADVTPAEVMKLCHAKIEASMHSVNSDKGKSEVNECIAIYRGVASRLCEEASSVSITGHHVLTGVSICIELDLNNENKNDKELNNFITKILRWIESAKVSHNHILELLQMPFWDAFPDQVLKLIGALTNRCSQQQKESVLLPMFGRIVNIRFDDLRQRVEGITGSSIENHTLNIFTRELSAFIELVNDEKFSALLTGEGAVWRDNLSLMCHAFKDEVFQCLGNHKRFLRECVASQIKNVVMKNDNKSFDEWFRRVTIILSNELVFDEDYLHTVLRMILRNINNPDFLVMASDIIADAKIAANPLKLSLAILHMAVLNGYEDKTEKFLERLATYLKMSGLADENTNAVLSEIDSYANGLFIDKQCGTQLYFGYIPGRSEAVVFSEEKALGEGDCGFVTLGKSRAHVVKTLLLCADDENARKQLWEDIYEAFQTNNLEPTLEFIQLYSAYQETTITEAVREKRRLKLAKYCQKKAVFLLYIEAYRDKLWLSYQSALLYARLSGITLYIWGKTEYSQQLVLKGLNVSGLAKGVIHMLLTSKFTHYNLLVEAPGSAVALNKNISSDFNDLFGDDCTTDGWEKFPDFLDDDGELHVSSGEDHQSIEDDKPSPKTKLKPVPEQQQALPGTNSQALNRNNFKLKPIPTFEELEKVPKHF